MSLPPEYEYVGNELSLFINASNWKSYWASRLRSFVRGRVLDVGAGLGATFDYLSDCSENWTCLEPDAALCAELAARLSSQPRSPRVLCGTLAKLGADERFDTIVYIDVLEHIEHDRAELAQAAQHLEPRGALIVLSPALPALFSPFDRSVGHFRRYTRRSLERVTPEGLSVKSWFYLDGLGVLPSLFARFAKRSAPSAAQIGTWDKLIVPVSRLTDTLTSRWFGRTLIMVWVKR